MGLVNIRLSLVYDFLPSIFGYFAAFPEIQRLATEKIINSLSIGLNTNTISFENSNVILITHFIYVFSKLIAQLHLIISREF